MKFRLTLAVVWLATMFLCSSCLYKRFLAKDEYLLKKNSVELIAPKENNNPANLAESLNGYAKPKPNAKTLGLFRARLWVYNRTYITPRNHQTWRSMFIPSVLDEQLPDTIPLQAYIYKRFAEKPVLLDVETIKRSEKSMILALNNAGYFNPKAGTKVKLLNRKQQASVTYVVTPGERLSMDSVIFAAKDTLLLKKVPELQSASLLTKGGPIDKSLFEQERGRITNLMRSRGYAFFAPSFVLFQADTVNATGANVYVNLLSPDKSPRHLPCTIDSVFVYVDIVGESGGLSSVNTVKCLSDDNCRVIFYNSSSASAKIRRETIAENLFLLPGANYDQHEYTRSIKALGNLGLFRYINIRLERTSETDSLLNLRVVLNTNKKIALGADIESNTAYSNLGTNLGASAGFNFRHRNLFKGAETFFVNLQVGAEIAFDSASLSRGNIPLNALDFEAQTGIYFPRLTFPYYYLDRYFKPYNMRTSLSIAYNYLRRVGFLTTTGLQASYGAEWRNETETMRRSLSLLNLSLLLKPNVDEAFQTTLDENVYLRNSFNPFFLVSFLNFSYTYTGKTAPNGNSWYFRINGESSGNLLNIIDRIAAPQDTLTFLARLNGGEGIPYSQFVRLETDLRFYKILGRRHSFAARGYLGAGYAYSYSNILPYARQFFSGGTNSLRAWRVRELGPGGYNPSEDQLPDRSGDFKLEMSAEYRFDVISYLEMALFVDAGNVWTFRTDPIGSENPRSDIDFRLNRFLSEVAIGGGLGFRLNFSYFIIRADWGLQLRRPFVYTPTSKTQWIDRFNFQNSTLGIAIGYPF